MKNLANITITGRNHVASLFSDGRLIYHNPTNPSWVRLLRLLNTSCSICGIIFTNGVNLAVFIQHLA